MALVFISLGSNIEPRKKNLWFGMEQLHQDHDSSILDWSSLYETKAITLEPQPDFINAVVKLETCLEPEVLLQRLLSIEAKSGRIRTGRQSPRPLDMDILLYDQKVIANENITIPHPRMLERGFVMVPLLEIAPDVRHPRADGPIKSVVSRFSKKGVSRLPGEKHWWASGEET